MDDISIFGLTGQVIASNTYPNGFEISAFADDGDPLDSPDLQVADTAMGPNGDAVTWSRPEMIEVVVNVMPKSQDDINLTCLEDANRVAKGKSGAKDIITIVWTYPDGSTVTGSEGKMISGPILSSGTAAGRLKTKRFVFRFPQLTRQAASTQ
jgi:hypothetical protein